MKLNEYVTLGRSGLRVSPLCLGTMTFGTEWGWGADEESSLRMTKVAQLDSNLASLDFTIPAELRARLDQASALDPTARPYVFFGPKLQARIRGDLSIRPWMRSNA